MNKKNIINTVAQVVISIVGGVSISLACDKINKECDKYIAKDAEEYKVKMADNDYICLDDFSKHTRKTSIVVNLIRFTSAFLTGLTAGYGIGWICKKFFPIEK